MAKKAFAGIMAALQDALAFSQGDKKRARIVMTSEYS